MDKDLLQDIKRDRIQQRRKQTCNRDVLHRVKCIITEYGLNEKFLELVDKAEDYLPRNGIGIDGVKAKSAMEFPPYCLVSEQNYRLALTIVEKLNNPYLQFAHSPEELLFSLSLHKADPSISTEDLLRYDFETLLLHKCVKEEPE